VFEPCAIQAVAWPVLDQHPLKNMAFLLLYLSLVLFLVIVAGPDHLYGNSLLSHVEDCHNEPVLCSGFKPTYACSFHYFGLLDFGGYLLGNDY